MQRWENIREQADTNAKHQLSKTMKTYLSFCDPVFCKFHNRKIPLAYSPLNVIKSNSDLPFRPIRHDHCLWLGFPYACKPCEAILQTCRAPKFTPNNRHFLPPIAFRAWRFCDVILTSASPITYYYRGAVSNSTVAKERDACVHKPIRRAGEIQCV